MDAAPPPRDRLDALSADDWAVLLGLVREALGSLPDTAGRAEIRASPTGRLAGGRGRRRLSDLLVADRQLWQGVVTAAGGEEGSRSLVARLVEPAAPAEASSRDRSHRGDAELRRRAERDRRRLVEVRDERDTLRRRLAEVEGRATRGERDRDRLTAEVEELRGELDQLRRRLHDAERAQQRAVDRERRRGEAERSRVEEELSALRRDREQSRTSRSAEPGSAPTGPAVPARQPAPQRPIRLVPGRPSRLPAGIAPGTREAAELLLHRDRLVLVDGYNVTKQRHAGLGLEQQRTWLVQALENLARQRGIRPIVVFDGAAAPGGGHRTRLLEVRFSPAAITADDEIVLAVEGTDEPLLVVTDDRELRARVAVSGADTLASRELLWFL